MDELSLDKQNTSTSKLQNDDEDSFSVRKVSSSSSLILLNPDSQIKLPSILTAYFKLIFSK